MMNRMIALLMSAFCMSAFAQNASTPVAMHGCKKPVVTGKLDTDEATDAFLKQLVDYKTCMMKYIDDMKKQAAPLEAASAAAAKELDDYSKSTTAVKAVFADLRPASGRGR